MHYSQCPWSNRDHHPEIIVIRTAQIFKFFFALQYKGRH
ncbi:hypothetical protein APY04_0962 [Hyphomicrobium sulfonivorans]|uniref:Uncharacterized protein n=1 Tax=Hyphomicrobium sulfonivorans TaxID=121290 RepID=A0A109BKN1_HYPSL|nr:hypothetical protein APY04_0962 [Hyphomicrobium sulfonivorans]